MVESMRIIFNRFAYITNVSLLPFPVGKRAKMPKINKTEKELKM